MKDSIDLIWKICILHDSLDIRTIHYLMKFHVSCGWGGLVGFKISFPVSSQLILKSPSTLRALWVIILGAITRLCTPSMNNITAKNIDQKLNGAALINHWVLHHTLTNRLPNKMLVRVKKGWLHKLCVNETADVFGSVNQCQAPTAVHIEIKPSNTINEICKSAI